MRVNWTPFLTLFPLRLPAKDILVMKKRVEKKLVQLVFKAPTIQRHMSLVLRRVIAARPFHSSHPRPAPRPTVTTKPFSELPKRPHDTPSASPPPVLTRPRRGRKPKTLVSDTVVLPKQPRNSLATGILANHSRFPHCILLTRVGQFYEVRATRDAPASH